MHVAGLPADCQDADVETELARLLSAADNDSDSSVILQQVTSDAVPRDGTGNVVDVANAGSADNAAPGVEEEQTAVNSESLLAGFNGLTIDSDPAASRPTRPTTLRGTDEREIELEEESTWQPFVSCAVVRCKTTGNCKGYCFLAFDSPQEAKAAVARLNEAGYVMANGKEAVKAQLSQPKERHAKPKEPSEANLHDVRLRRQRYQFGSKKAKMGNKTCSDKSKSVTTRTGRVDVVTGTRGQTIIDPTARLSSRSGFATAT